MSFQYLLMAEKKNTHTLCGHGIAAVQEVFANKYNPLDKVLSAFPQHNRNAPNFLSLFANGNINKLRGP